MTRRALVALVVVAASVLGAAPAHAVQPDPTFTVTQVEAGLAFPWDVTFLPQVGSAIPSGTMLYTERSTKKLTLRLPNREKRVILDNPPGMWANGETGLMSVEPMANFAANRQFMTCHGYQSGGTTDIRVVLWQFAPDFLTASFVKNLVTGLPVSSGRHGGCAIVRGAGYDTYIGTGDAAIGTNPQSLFSGGGKVLYIDARTGVGMPTNPYPNSPVMTKRILTFGHRNVQGLARRADGRVWSIEQGSYRDDEVNLLVRNGNYGWNPVPRKAGDPSYNENSNSPMTDFALPGAQLGPAWRSGTDTEATSGGAWVYGAKWMSAHGALAVCELKDQAVRFMLFDTKGKLTRTWRPAALTGTYGRLRACVHAPDGDLYVTTSNGSNDKILRITPR